MILPPEKPTRPAEVAGDTFRDIWHWLRPYQRDFILDSSRYISSNKTRRAGYSDAVAFKAVLIASGIYTEVFSDEEIAAEFAKNTGYPVGPISCDNVNIVSKDQDAADQVIQYAKRWVEVLRRLPQFAKALGTKKWNESTVRFANGKHIKAYAQAPGAGRSGGGHLILDEAAHYAHHADIEKGAVPTINSDPSLTLTRISTPNGVTGQGELFYRICQFPEEWPEYSRHRLTLAEAVEQGFPADLEEIRAQCPNEDVFQQEYMCSFLGAGQNYFSYELMLRARAALRVETEITYMGIDVASEVDLTAVTVWRLAGGSLYLAERYLISGVPYASDAEVIGQDKILAAIIQHYQPARTCIDATGDTGTILTGLGAQNLPTQLVMHHVKRDWKWKHVPRFKGAFERGEVLVSRNARTYVYDRAKAEIEGSVSVDTCFGPMPRDPLERDFAKVRKTLTTGGAPTFDTTRDADGHGDLFWSSIYGWWVAHTESRVISKPQVHHTGSRITQVGGW